MKLAGMHIGRRRLAAGGVGLAGLVTVAVVAAGIGGEAGLVVLAAVAAAGGVLLGAGLVLTWLRRQQRPAGEAERRPGRAPAERWEEIATAQREEIGTLQASVRELRQSVDIRIDAVLRDQRRSVAVACWQRAVRRRDGSGQEPADRAEEVALIGGSDLFDPQWYREQAGTRMPDPVGHYVDTGAAAGLDPHPLFPATAYLERHPDALLRWRTPLAHYLATRRDPAAVFDTPVVRRSRLGNPDEDDLKWEYLARGLREEADTFVLYRIVGNDLPPRHRPGQSLDNLRFILGHEPELPGCRKRWVVNRIVDPRIEKQVLSLLEERGRPFLHIPFLPEEYRRIGWRFDGLPLPGFTYRDEFEQLPPSQRRRVLDHVFHHKNLYVMNNNGARNAALREGRSLAKWVLPWDGNCFLTEQAWEELVQAISQRPYLKYFTVPMARVLDNRVLLRPDPAVDASEEPQVVFRRDAKEEFDPHARYGRRPKVELFYRLRVPGPWDQWGRHSWDAPTPAPSTEAGQVGQGGWVARLFSGREKLEFDTSMRQRRRTVAIRECLEKVDEEQTRGGFAAADLFTLDERALARQRDGHQRGEPGPVRVVAQLLDHAGRVRARRLESVPAMIDSVTTAALAGYFSGEEQYSARGAELLRAWFLGDDAKLRPGGALATGLLDVAATGGLHHLVDAARLLERAGALTGSEPAHLRSWFDAYRRWLEESDPGRSARMALDHRGTWFDVQVAAISAYLDDVGGALAALRRAHDRVGQQFEPDEAAGRPGDRPAHGGTYNLYGWLALATFAGRLGQDLWAYRSPGGGDLAGGFEAVLGRPDPSGAEDPSHRAVLTHLGAGSVPAAVVSSLPDPYRDPWQVRQVFDPAAGVRPFWVLGAETS